MNENLQTLKAQYNALLKRYEAAEAYIDDKKRKPEELDKWMPSFLQIVKQLNKLLIEIGEHRAEEAINGFKEET